MAVRATVRPLEKPRAVSNPIQTPTHDRSRLTDQLVDPRPLVDPARGQAMQDELVKLGYPAAFDNAGSLLLNAKYCRQHCINEAVKLFRKGAALGDPDAMMSLADQIDQNHATGDKISLYQRAAKLGHPRAKMALEALDQERALPPIIFRFPY
jgi:TPR repeat protein